MELFLSSTSGIIVVITLVIVGGVAIYGIADKTMRDRRKDALEAADGLIGTLQKTIVELEDRLKTVEVDYKSMSTQMAALHVANETLTKVLQGRDDNSIQFQSKVFEAVNLAQDTNKIVRALENGVEKMVKATEHLAKTMEAKQA